MKTSESMEIVLRTDIPFRIDPAAVARDLEAEGNAVSVETLERLAAEARSVGRPKILIRPAAVSGVEENAVRLGEYRFSSRAMAVHFAEASRVFPYLATAGTELADWVESLPDSARTAGDRMAEAALGAALSAVETEVRDRFGIDGLARVHPGSLVDWDLSEQRILFDFLGDTRGRIGVRLDGNLWMHPPKSGSGIVFPDRTGFVVCRLCPVSGCRLRRADFEPGRYERCYGAPQPASSAS